MTVKSPDGKIQGVFTLHNGVLSWNMEYNETPVIHNSTLGIGSLQMDCILRMSPRAGKHQLASLCNGNYKYI